MNRIILSKSFCFATVLCLSVFSAQAAPDDTFELANSDFSKGNFAQAAEKYQALIDNGHFSKSLFFNLGTSLYRSGSPGEGVLWFRRAQLLDPGMAEVRQNVEFLRSKLGFLEFSSSKTDRFLLRFSPTLLRWLISLGFWLIGFALIGLLFVRRLDRFRTLIVTSMVFAAIVTGVSIWAANYRAKNLAIDNFATVTALTSKAVTAPVPGAKIIIDLPPGSEVKILQKSDHWTYVAIPGDLRGWLRSENLQAVWPLPSPSK